MTARRSAVGGLARTTAEARQEASRRPTASRAQESGIESIFATAPAAARTRAGAYHGRSRVFRARCRRVWASGSAARKYQAVARIFAGMFGRARGTADALLSAAGGIRVSAAAGAACARSARAGRGILGGCGVRRVALACSALLARIGGAGSVGGG